MSEAVLILGDQLNLSLSSLEAAGPNAEIFMTVDKMGDERRAKIANSAAKFLGNL